MDRFLERLMLAGVTLSLLSLAGLLAASFVWLLRHW